MVVSYPGRFVLKSIRTQFQSIRTLYLVDSYPVFSRFVSAFGLILITYAYLGQQNTHDLVQFHTCIYHQLYLRTLQFLTIQLNRIIYNIFVPMSKPKYNESQYLFSLLYTSVTDLTIQP